MPHQMEPVRDVDGVALRERFRATFLDATLESLRMDARVGASPARFPRTCHAAPSRNSLREKLALVLFGAELEPGIESLEPWWSGSMWPRNCERCSWPASWHGMGGRALQPGMPQRP